MRCVTKDFTFKNKPLHVETIGESSTGKLVPSLLSPSLVSLKISEFICFYDA